MIAPFFMLCYSKISDLMIALIRYIIMIEKNIFWEVSI